jgi:hypothetical protein
MMSLLRILMGRLAPHRHAGPYAQHAEAWRVDIGSWMMLPWQ